MPLPSSLLDVPAYPAAGYAVLADRLKRLLGCSGDLLFVQGEAIVALEAVAASLARPGLEAVNVVTSPYGGLFGAWLRRGGANVVDVVAVPGRPIAVEAVAETLAAKKRVDIVAVVHAEAANGSLNPLSEIATLANQRGAIIAVDAVASVGAHSVAIDADGLDVVVIGPQKGLGGPAGVSAVTINAGAWRLLEAAGAPVQSTLSLLDRRDNWLKRGRGVLPGMPAALEFWALEAALDRVEAEGIDALIARHAKAALATRAGLRGLGQDPWIEADECAAAVVTTVRVPAGMDPKVIIGITAAAGASLSPGVGEGAADLVRLDHTGPRAAFAAVLTNITAYGAALAQAGVAVDVGAGAAAVARVYATLG
jgi:aspartate aminotransferase-like enzyme